MESTVQFFYITELPNYKQTQWNTRSSYEFYLFHFMMCNILPFIKPPKGGTVRYKEKPVTVPQGLLHPSFIWLLIFMKTKLSPLDVMWCYTCGHKLHAGSPVRSQELVCLHKAEQAAAQPPRHTLLGLFLQASSSESCTVCLGDPYQGFAALLMKLQGMVSSSWACWNGSEGAWSLKGEIFLSPVLESDCGEDFIHIDFTFPLL